MLLTMRKMQLIVCLVITFILLLSCSSPQDSVDPIKQQYEELKSLVHEGLDIDEAVMILKNNGFRVGEKHYPTKEKSYMQVNVPLSSSVPFSATAAETTGKGTGKNVYVIIKADKNNKIIAIEH